MTPENKSKKQLLIMALKLAIVRANPTEIATAAQRLRSFINQEQSANKPRAIK